MTMIDFVENRKLNSKEDIALAVMEALGTNDVKVGSTVTVINDPSYPFEGQKGTVKSMKGGFSLVEFKNGTKVNLQTSLLIPV